MRMPSTVVFLAVVLPWLNPFSSGPAPAVIPWLVTLGCLALLLLGAARVRLAALVPAAWLVAALISAAFAVLQYFDATAALQPWVNATALGEAFANLRQRNQFATLTNIGLAALLWWVAHGAPASDSPGAITARRAWQLAAAVLLAVGNAASSSRTGLAQLLLLLAMAWAWRRVGRKEYVLWSVALAAMLAYLVAALALPVLAGLDPLVSGILARLHDGGPGCSSRLTLWRNVLYLIIQKPWFGWGWGELDFAHFITLYPGQRFCDILDNAHNLPLHLAVELGLPLALTVCAVTVWLVWRAQPWRETDATRQLAWGVLAIIVLHSLLEYPLWYGPFQMAFGLSIWLLWRRVPHLSQNQQGFSALGSVLCTSTAIILIALTGWTGWDYYRVSQIYRAPAMRAEAYRSNTLKKIRDSWLFASQVRFAELTTTELTLNNARYLHDMAVDMLHFSPEARVIEKLVESATLLGLEDEALFYLVRYEAAFPDSHARWEAGRGPARDD